MTAHALPATTAVRIDAQTYSVQVRRAVRLAPAAPRLVIAAYQPNAAAQALLRTAVRAFQTFTPEPHELWVVDNCSPEERLAWLREWPGVNVIFNRTEPVPADARPGATQAEHGSFANAAALELAVRLIDPDSALLMSLHMDTAPAQPGWLSCLCARLNDRVRAVGVRLDRVRVPEGTLHVLGCLVDFQLFRRLGLSYWPDLPRLDVGDAVSQGLRAAGYDLYACRNTLWDPGLAQLLPPGSPLRDLSVDRVFNEQGELIFLHLGRGIRQSAGQGPARPVSIEQWVQVVEGLVAAAARQGEGTR